MHTRSMNHLTPAFTIQVLYKKLLIVLLWLLLPYAAMAAEYDANPDIRNGAGNTNYSATQIQGLTMSHPPMTATNHR